MKHNGVSSVLNTDYNNQEKMENKIELIGCPFGGKNCKNHLAEINNYYIASARYKEEKNYQQAIEMLKAAYYKTLELKQTTCIKCADLFRATITQTLEEMHKDLMRMSTGFFRNKRYRGVCIEAENALNELAQSN